MKSILSVILAAASVTAAGCMAATKAPDKPGLYNGPAYLLQGGSLYGAVGLPFQARPIADCREGNWSARAELATGALPPGLTLNSDDTITGVPTMAGDWYFSVRYVDVVCAGKTYVEQRENVNVKVAGSSR